MDRLGDILIASFYTAFPILVVLVIIYLIGLKEKGGEKE
ncbi:MAG: hypothetical protein DDT18_00596 [Actinobacteria bacterium]|nr:hypothetical protein [Actinomycetota bacterium]